MSTMLKSSLVSISNMQSVTHTTSAERTLRGLNSATSPNASPSLNVDRRRPPLRTSAEPRFRKYIQSASSFS